MISTEQFMERFGNIENGTKIQFGTIDPKYTSGQPSVIYDSDIIQKTLSKRLKRLASYTPAANDRVLIVNGVIIGKIV